MTEPSMTNAAPATLTEQELFAIFSELPIRVRNAFGTIKRTTLALEYTPSEYMREGGAYGEMEDATNLLADYLLAEERPEEAIGTLIGGLEAYANQLQTVLDDFRTFKSMHRIEPDLPHIPPSDPEAENAWSAAWEESDNNPRFVAPELTAGEAA